MGFLGKLVSATIGTALTPVALVKDVLDLAANEEADTTKETIKGITEDLGGSIQDLGKGKLL